MEKNEELGILDGERMKYILRKEVLTLEEAIFYLGFKRSYMYQLTSNRLIPHYSPGGKNIFFKRSELDAWVFKGKRLTRQEIEEGEVAKE